jgi:hypothetical protein
MKSCSNLDGVLKYDVLSAINPIDKNYFEDTYLSAEGESDLDGEYSAEGYSNAGGLKRLSKNFRANQQKRQARRDTRTQAKLLDAQGRKAVSENLGKDKKSDILMAKALANTSKTPALKPGLSNTAKIAIAVGSLAVLGVVGYFIYKKTKGKGK